MLFRLMMLTWSCGLSPVAPLLVPLLSPSSLSGSASAKASSVVTSFLFGLLRLGVLCADFVTLFRSWACLIRRLSFFEDAKSDSAFAVALDATPLPEDFFKMDFLGCACRDGGSRRGACHTGCQIIGFDDRQGSPTMIDERHLINQGL